MGSYDVIVNKRQKNKGTSEDPDYVTEYQHKYYSTSRSNMVEAKLSFQNDVFNFLSDNFLPAIEEIKTSLDTACSVAGAFDIDGTKDLDDAKDKLDQLIEKINSEITALQNELNTDYTNVETELKTNASPLFGVKITTGEALWTESSKCDIDVS